MNSTTKPLCGFIGLGSQGAPMARRMIDAGYAVTLWARRPETLQAFAGTPAKVAGSAAALAAEVDHLGVCVVDDAGVVAVCEEVLPVMRAGARIAIHSTVHPDTCVSLAAQAAARGVALIDAPVSGGGPGAAAGTLTVMIGGEEAAVAAARPVFETFGQLILHLGQVGAGQLAKLVNNNLMAANLAMAHHALAAGDALGIGRANLVELLRHGSGRSFSLDVRASLPSPMAFASGEALLRKDIGLLRDVLDDAAPARALAEAALPFLALARGDAA